MRKNILIADLWATKGALTTFEMCEYGFESSSRVCCPCVWYNPPKIKVKYAYEAMEVDFMLFRLMQSSHYAILKIGIICTFLEDKIRSEFQTFYTRTWSSPANLVRTSLNDDGVKSSDLGALLCLWTWCSRKSSTQACLCPKKLRDISGLQCRISKLYSSVFHTGYKLPLPVVFCQTVDFSEHFTYA